jgi:hypothetical protein
MDFVPRKRLSHSILETLHKENNISEIIHDVTVNFWTGIPNDPESSMLSYNLTDSQIEHVLKNYFIAPGNMEVQKYNIKSSDVGVHFRDFRPFCVLAENVQNTLKFVSSVLKENVRARVYKLYHFYDGAEHRCYEIAYYMEFGNVLVDYNEFCPKKLTNMDLYYGQKTWIFNAEYDNKELRPHPSYETSYLVPMKNDRIKNIYVTDQD